MASLANILVSRIPEDKLPAIAHATKGQMNTVEALKKLAEMAKKNKEKPKNG